MAGLNGLTSTQIQAIAKALANVRSSYRTAGLLAEGRLYLYERMDLNALPSKWTRSPISLHRLFGQSDPKGVLLFLDFVLLRGWIQGACMLYNILFEI